MAGHPLTAGRGPTINRGLVAALGVGVDLGGPGARDWTSAPYVDPEDPNGTDWEKPGLVQFYADDPSTVPFETIAVPALCGPTTRVPVNQSPLNPIDGGATTKVLEVEGATLACSAMSYGDQSDAGALAEAKRRLKRVLWPTIANEIWDGAAAIANALPNQYLRRAAGVTVVKPGTFSIAAGIGLLEGALAAAGYGADRNLVYLPFSLVQPAGSDFNILSTTNSDRMLTHNGNLIVADPGFITGNGPVGNAAAAATVSNVAAGADGFVSAWIYMTARLQVRLGEAYEVQGPTPISEGHGVIPATNDIRVAYRQPFVYGWPGPTLAIRVEHRW